MISILRGNTDVEMLQGKAAYDDIKAVMNVKDQIDVVILSYGMNDFLAQAPINNSDRPWTGFGTALSEGVKGVRSVFPQAQILITSPNYASYFPVPVKNMGEKALYNYASIACDVAVGQGTLCVDTYDNLGVDAYNADEYLEDGIHLNEKEEACMRKPSHPACSTEQRVRSRETISLPSTDWIGYQGQKDKNTSGSWRNPRIVYPK